MNFSEIFSRRGSSCQSAKTYGQCPGRVHNEKPPTVAIFCPQTVAICSHFTPTACPSFSNPPNIWIFSNIFNLGLKGRKYSLCFISKQSTKHAITSSDTIFQIERKFCCILHPLCFSLGKESRLEIREIHAVLEMFFFRESYGDLEMFLSEREMFFNSP